MIYFLQRTLFVLFIAGFWACASEPQNLDEKTASAEASVKTYQGRGVVQTITPSKTFVNIDHEAIPGFMDAMAMMFPLKDTTVVEGVAVGDSIRFTIEAGLSMPQVVDIEVIEFQ